MKRLSAIGRTIGRFKRLPKVLHKGERFLVAVALFVLVIGIAGLYWSKHRSYETVPVAGGEFVEGVVANSNAEVEADIQDLVGVGLIRFNEKNEIVDGVAESYEIADDGKKYTFKLKPTVDATDIANQLNQSGKLSDKLKIEAKDNTLVISLTAPFAPLLSDLTLPLITPGPYSISKQSNEEILLSANQNFILGKPYIPTIRIKIFSNQADITKALNRGEISAASSPETIKGMTRYDLVLPRHIVLFFNVKRKPWDDAENRRKLARSEQLSTSQTLIVTTTQDQIDLLGELKKRFEPLGVKVEQRLVDQATLDKDILPKHDFDALLYGIDLGRDPDPYAFWHSSQIDGGQNLSGFSSKEADKLLESARLVPDLNERLKKYSDLQKILDDQVPAIFLEQVKMPYLVSNKVKGIIINMGITPTDRFKNVWQWYIRSKKVPK